MPDIQEAAETARFWVSWGQAAGLGKFPKNAKPAAAAIALKEFYCAVGVTAAATAIGAAIASKAMDNIDEAAYDDMKLDKGRRRRMTFEEAAQQQQEQQEQQPPQKAAQQQQQD